MVVYYAPKAMKQRREQGRSTAGMVVVMILGILEIIGGLAIYAFMIFALMKGTS